MSEVHGHDGSSTAKKQKRKADVEEQSVGKETPKKPCQRFKSSYSQLWKHLSSSSKGEMYVHCSLCSVDFSCAHGGKYDCKRHVERKHLDLLKLSTENVSMAKFCTNARNDGVSNMKRNVTRAELIMSTMVAKMNMPFSTAPVLTAALKKMFPDSKIAAEMACGRSKCTALVKELQLIAQETLSQRMIKGPFTLSTDGSTDEKSKQFPLVVRTIDTTSDGLVSSELLSVPICEGSATGENIFKLIDHELTRRNIPWENCLSLGCDNAAVMTGHKKGVFAFVKEKHPQVFLSGCTLHLVHIGAKKAAAAAALPPVEEILIDIYYFFNKSEKRQSTFKGIQDIFDLDQKKMLKHGCTRWLSIGRCVARLLYNWEALKVYFKEEKEVLDAKKMKKVASSSKKPASSGSLSTSVKSCAVQNENNEVMESQVATYAQKKVDTIYDFTRSPTNKLYCLFLNYTKFLMRSF